MSILWHILFLAFCSSMHGFVLRPLTRLDARQTSQVTTRRGLKHFSLAPKKLLRMSHLRAHEENTDSVTELIGNDDNNNNRNGTAQMSSSSDTYTDTHTEKEQEQESTEKVFREYPFYHMGLPVLDDAKNYYCGQYEDCFWHQNADQVLLYVPIPESVSKSDISAVFNVHNVQISVKGEELLFFNCPERIIPDGSFWVIERDCNDQRYIQVDLEKRFRMINWNSLFSANKQNESSVELSEKRSKMLEKLLAANKGMSKVTGLPPETINEMMKDETLLHALSDVQQPRAYTRDESGAEVAVDPSVAPAVPEIFSRDQSIIDLLENRSLEDRIKSISASNSTLALKGRDLDLENEIALITGQNPADSIVDQEDSDVASEATSDTVSEAMDETTSNDVEIDEIIE